MRKLWIFLPLLLLLASCEPAPNPTAILPTATPKPSQTPTATTIWFPATETPTPRPEIVHTPTPDLRTGIGSIIIEDQFEEPENWVLTSAQNGSATIANNHLTMVLTLANQYAYATYKNLFIFNFYGEITAQPNLCGDQDEYGIIIRVKDLTDYYRLAVTCDGMVSVIRLVNGSLFSVIPSRPANFQQTGPPSSVKIGVWAHGNEIRFFINDQFLFSVQDLVTRSGTFGAFIHSVGNSALSVNFSDLRLWEVQQP